MLEMARLHNEGHQEDRDGYLWRTVSQERGHGERCPRKEVMENGVPGKRSWMSV